MATINDVRDRIASKIEALTPALISSIPFTLHADLSFPLYKMPDASGARTRSFLVRARQADGNVKNNSSYNSYKVRVSVEIGYSLEDYDLVDVDDPDGSTYDVQEMKQSDFVQIADLVRQRAIFTEAPAISGVALANLDQPVDLYGGKTREIVFYFEIIEPR